MSMKKSLMTLNHCTIHRMIKKLGKEDKKETIKYFKVKDLKFARFYLLPKIYKRLNNVPG